MKPYFKIIAFLTLAVLYACASENSQTSENESTFNQPDSVYSDGVFVDHEMAGAGEYTVLFIHGWCIDQSYWKDQVEFLKSDFKTVTIDLPGFGNSGTNRDTWTVEAYGDDVNAVIDQLGLTNVIVVGHSMGGDIAVEAALKNPEIIALVGIDNFKEVGMEYDAETMAQVDEFMAMLRSHFSAIAPAYAEGSLFHSSTSDAVKSRVMTDFMQSDSTVAISSLESLWKYGEREADQLQKMEQKLYLINSNTSPTLTDGLDAIQLDHKLVEIDSTGHYPMIEKPVEFNGLLKGVLMEITHNSL